MALTSLGRNAAFAEALDPKVIWPQLKDGETPDPEAQKAAAKKLEDTRNDVRKSLTPWIPGDFLVSYGAFITAWKSDLAGHFWWMVILAVASAFLFVWGGAFAATDNSNWSADLSKKLTVRSAIGAVVSLIAAATVPGSGWYDFSWFRDNEAAVLTTIGVLTGGLVLILKGLERRKLLDAVEGDNEGGAE